MLLNIAADQSSCDLLSYVDMIYISRKHLSLTKSLGDILILGIYYYWLYSYQCPVVILVTYLLQGKPNNNPLTDNPPFSIVQVMSSLKLMALLCKTLSLCRPKKILEYSWLITETRNWTHGHAVAKCLFHVQQRSVWSVPD